MEPDGARCGNILWLIDILHYIVSPQTAPLLLGCSSISSGYFFFLGRQCFISSIQLIASLLYAELRLLVSISKCNDMANAIVTTGNEDSSALNSQI